MIIKIKNQFVTTPFKFLIPVELTIFFCFILYLKARHMSQNIFPDRLCYIFEAALELARSKLNSSEIQFLAYRMGHKFGSLQKTGGK